MRHIKLFEQYTNSIGEAVEKKDQDSLIKYLKDLKTKPEKDTVFKVGGKVVPKSDIDKLIGKEGNTGDSNPLKLKYIDTWHEGQYKVKAGKIKAGIELMTQAANDAEKLAKEEQDGGIAGEAGYYRGTVAWLKKDYNTVKKYINDKFVKLTGNDEVLNRLLKSKDKSYKEAYHKK